MPTEIFGNKTSCVSLQITALGAQVSNDFEDPANKVLLEETDFLLPFYNDFLCSVSANIWLSAPFFSPPSPFFPSEPGLSGFSRPHWSLELSFSI